MSDDEDGTAADRDESVADPDDGGSPLSGIDAAMRGQFDWYPVAKKEFQDTVRSKLLWLLSAVFVVVFALPAFFGLYLGLGELAQQQGQALTTDSFFAIATRLGSALIPLVAIVVGYASIVGERESGSLKVLLSLPYSRRDVLVGKVLGRSAVVAVPILIGFIVSVVVLLTANVQLASVGFVLATLLTVLLGVVFTGLAVGVSAATSTGRRAIVWTVGIYVYLFVFWNSFARSAGGLLREYTGVAAGSTLQLTVLLKLLNPTQAYQTLVDSALGQSALSARTGMFQNQMEAAAYCQQALGGNVSLGQGGGFTCAPAGGLPAYFSDPAALLYMLLWIAVPLLIGYRLFDGADL